MKKFLIASGVAAIAMTAVAFAQSYQFNTNLTIGSTGADVSALQTAVMAAGYDIPSISSGAAAKGYFGSQTQAAVKLYQAAHGIPNTGFVGPLTRAALNSGSTMTSTTGGTTTAVNCPAGYTCTAAAAPVVTCPAGYTCTATTGTGTVTGTGSAGITTPGVAGTLDIANGSIVGNGTSVNDGQEVDLGSISLQSGASDMAVTSVSIDFNVRPWLYMSALSFRDQSGNTLATVNNLSASNFSEITVGSDYRITIPVSEIIPKATKVYAVMHGVFASSNRSPQSIAITRVQVRATDGTGVTLTSDTGVLASTVMYVAYNGQQGSSLIVTTDTSAPKTGNIIQTNTGNTQTKDVLLGVWDLKSQNINSTLQGLTVNLSMNGIGSVGSTFAYLTLKSGSTSLNTGTPATASASTSDVTFSNFNLALPANQYVPVSVYGTVNGNVNGITASTSLVATAANITGIDSSSNNLTVSSSGTIPGSGNQTFSLSGNSLTGLTWNLQSTAPGGNYNRYPSQTLFTGSFTVTAGNNPIYVSTTGSTALTLATTSSVTSSMTDGISAFSPADGTESWDSSGSYYQVLAGTSRTFNFTGSLALSAASTTQVLASVGVTSVNLSSTAAGVSSSPTNLAVTTQLQGLNSDFAKGSVYLNGSN
ncbi:MAG: peptidoglycan-binding protein [Patescibacteria group bacterium]|nr:peptidoglycan-binding protein [Patescibacteria group bacterium]